MIWWVSVPVDPSAASPRLGGGGDLRPYPPRLLTGAAMKRVMLGATKTQVPNVVLGLMRIADLDDESIRGLVGAARDAGIDFFDHADVYGPDMHTCERRFAAALRLRPSERESVTLQTKAGIVKDGPYFDFSHQHLIDSVEGS